MIVMVAIEREILKRLTHTKGLIDQILTIYFSYHQRHHEIQNKIDQISRN